MLHCVTGQGSVWWSVKPIHPAGATAEQSQRKSLIAKTPLAAFAFHLATNLSPRGAGPADVFATYPEIYGF